MTELREIASRLGLELNQFLSAVRAASLARQGRLDEAQSLVPEGITITVGVAGEIPLTADGEVGVAIDRTGASVYVSAGPGPASAVAMQQIRSATGYRSQNTVETVAGMSGIDAPIPSSGSAFPRVSATLTFGIAIGNREDLVSPTEQASVSYGIVGGMVSRPLARDGSDFPPGSRLVFTVGP